MVNFPKEGRCQQVLGRTSQCENVKILTGLLRTIAISFPLLFPLTSYAGESEIWFLMARHGECHKMAVLKRKVPEIAGVKNPESFKKLMESMGHKVIIKKLEGLEGKAVQVSVPDKGLDLMFVKKSVCKEFGGK